MKTIIAYTDGSAVVSGKNKGRGGFGTYFPDFFGERKAFSLGYKQGKTGQMELTALLYAIKALRHTYGDMKVKLIIYSDSEYVVKSFTEYRLMKWIKAGWRNSSGVVANLEIWKEICNELYTIRGHYLELEMRHIRSHQVEKARKEGNIFKVKNLMDDPHIIGNMVADRLADYKRHKKLI